MQSTADPPSKHAASNPSPLAPIHPAPALAGAPQSIAGTLPPELLIIIFKYTEQLSDADPRHQQLDRIRQSSVCRSWFAARFRSNDYFVDSETRASALIDALERSPARAARVEKLEVSGASQHWATLLSLSVNATEVCLTNIGAIENDLDDTEILLSLSSTVTKLKLDLSSDGKDEERWLPNFFMIGPAVELDLALKYDGSQTDCGYSATRVLEYLSPVLSQLTALSLFCQMDEIDQPEEEPGFLEALLPAMTALKVLKVDMYPVKADNLAECIGALTTLEELHLLNVGLLQEEFHPDLIGDVIEQAGDALRLVVVAPGPYINGWTAGRVRDLEESAGERGIVLLEAEAEED